MRKINNAYFYACAFWALVAFTSCTKTPAPVEAPKPLENTALVSDWPNKDWDKLAITALEAHGQALLNASPLDAKDYCPNFSSLDLEKRKAFYLMLLSAMARFESSFDATNVYTEACYVNGKKVPESEAPKGCGIKDRFGNYVQSAGLLQLSVESGNASIYKCGLKATKDLFDPKTNLECAVKILNYWVPNDKILGKERLGGARYWSVLRDSPPVNYKKQQAIKEKTKSLSFCK